LYRVKLVGLELGITHRTFLILSLPKSTKVVIDMCCQPYTAFRIYPMTAINCAQSSLQGYVSLSCEEKFLYERLQSGFQRNFSANVCCGILAKYILKSSLTVGVVRTDGYKSFLYRYLPFCWEDVPLSTEVQILEKYNGAPHTSKLIGVLKANKKNEWKQRKIFGSPVPSPDFNPFNYFFCFYTKPMTYHKGKLQIKE